MKILFTLFFIVVYTIGFSQVKDSLTSSPDSLTLPETDTTMFELATVNIYALTDLFEAEGILKKTHADALRQKYDSTSVGDGLGVVLEANPAIVKIRPLDFVGKSRLAYFDALYQDIKTKYFPNVKFGKFTNAEDGTMDVLAVPIGNKIYEFYSSIPVEYFSSGYFELYGFASALEGIDLWPLNLYLQEIGADERLTFIKDKEMIYVLKANEVQMATIEEVYYLDNPYFIKSKTEKDLRTIIKNLQQFKKFNSEKTVSREEIEVLIDDLMRTPALDIYRILVNLNTSILSSCFYIELYERSDENLLMLNFENIKQLIDNKELAFIKDNFDEVMGQSPYENRTYIMTVKTGTKEFSFTYPIEPLVHDENEEKLTAYLYVPFEAIANFVNESILADAERKIYTLVANGEFYYIYLTEEEKDSVMDNLGIVLNLPEK